MVTIRLHNALVALLSSLLMSASCTKEEEPEFVDFVFEIPVTIMPGADTVSRGDTLWLALDFSDSLLDRRSNQHYRIRPQDLDLTTGIGFRKLLGPTEYAGSFAQGFTVVSKAGQISAGGGTFRTLMPVYDGHHYRALIGIVPLFTGVYALNMLSTVKTPARMPFLSLEQGVKGRSRQAYLRDFYYIINKGDVHFSLQQQHSRVTSTLPGSAEANTVYEQQSTFTFVVK